VWAFISFSGLLLHQVLFQRELYIILFHQPPLEAIAIPFNCLEMETLIKSALFIGSLQAAVIVVKKRQVFHEESGDLDELEFIQNREPKLIFG